MWSSVLRVLLTISAVLVGTAYSHTARQCFTEPGYHYNSILNQTALRKCTGPPLTQKVCIVGGGSSGIHMGWLLRRRGFDHVTVFEARDRLGGDAWEENTAGNVTRELGAAFLSPDYYEVRAMLARFNLTEVPISVSSMIRFHSSGEVLSNAQWYNAWVANWTGTADPVANSKVVGKALNTYVTLHHRIFGQYKGRFPPQPASTALLHSINGTILHFLDRNNISVLTPLMYQFFVLQGMGLLSEIPAYYVLKWVSPASLKAGGFGNDQDTPLAMVKEGYGELIQRMADEVQLDVRLGLAVKGIFRTPNMPVKVTLSDETTHECDILVLSGPITNYVRGSDDGEVSPILHPPTRAETELFGPKHAMQFLIQLVELENLKQPFKALEYWPESFSQKGQVIVRRDIRAAETNRTGGRLGGLQSYSYWPQPVCNKSVHLKQQEAWMVDQNLTGNVLTRAWYDTYLFHYPNSNDIMDAKPWKLDQIQLHQDTHTLYVGGSAGFETVEDSLNYNLELVARLFDQNHDAERFTNSPSPSPAPIVFHQRALEQLVFNHSVPCNEVDRLVEIDHSVWTTFLAKQDAFVRKHVLLSSVTEGGNCTVWSHVHWASRDLWKSIPAQQLIQKDTEFRQAFGYDPAMSAVPTSGIGLDVLSITGEPSTKLLADPSDEQFLEILSMQIPCKQEAMFIRADDATWTKVLSQQPGFIQKQVMIERAATCTMWVHTWWATKGSRDNIPVSVLEQAHSDFVQLFGSDPPLTRAPGGGLTILHTTDSSFTSVPAINGNDVVAYQSLSAGEKDVQGTPTIKRFIDSAPLLPVSLQHIHPKPYQFWFKTEANARQFDVNAWAFIPEFGGHCTHGIASRNDLNSSLLVDGRVAFTCVNTTEWVRMNGTVYMNSCGMYFDFIKNPANDAVEASKMWTKWFGQPRGFGPINDACFQDGGQWNKSKSPIADLIPSNCVIN